MKTGFFPFFLPNDYYFAARLIANSMAALSNGDIFQNIFPISKLPTEGKTEQLPVIQH